MKKNILFMFMAAAVWSSCSKNEIESPVIDDTNEIKVSSSLVDVNASTRTPYEGTDLAANPLTAWVLATTVGGTYSTALHAAGQMTFVGDNDANPGGTKYNKNPAVFGYSTLPATDGKFNLSGIYPVDGWGITSENISGGQLTFTLHGNEDVLYAPKVETSKPEIIEGTYAELAFEHQLTLLKLWVRGDADAISSGRTKIKSITLTKANGADLPTVFTIDLNSGLPNFGTTGTLSFYQKDSNTEYASLSYQLTGDFVEQAYVLAPPVQASATADTYEYTLQVAYKDNLLDRNAPVNIDLKSDASTWFANHTKGQQFNISLEFKGGEIRANATVAPWTINYGTAGDIEI